MQPDAGRQWAAGVPAPPPLPAAAAAAFAEPAAGSAQPAFGDTVEAHQGAAGQSAASVAAAVVSGGGGASAGSGPSLAAQHPPQGLHHLTRHWLPDEARGEAVLQRLGASDVRAAEQLIRCVGGKGGPRCRTGRYAATPGGWPLLRLSAARPSPVPGCAASPHTGCRLVPRAPPPALLPGQSTPPLVRPPCALCLLLQEHGTAGAERRLPEGVWRRHTGKGAACVLPSPAGCCAGLGLWRRQACTPFPGCPNAAFCTEQASSCSSCPS